MPSLISRGLTAYRFGWPLALVAALAAVAAGQFHAPAPTKLLHQGVLIAVAVILFRRRRTDPVAAMISLSFLLWAATASPALSASVGSAAAAVLDRIRFLLFVGAMMLFPEGRFRPAWTLYAVAATAVVAAIGCLAAFGAFPTQVYQLFAMGCAALAVVAMRGRFRILPPGIQRQQIKWVALGLGSGLLLVGSARFAAPTLAPQAAGPLFDAGVILMALGVLVSLLRYRLYDADAAISRSTAYGLLTLTLLAVFGVSEAALQALSQAWFGGGAGIVSGGIAAGIAAALTAPAHQRLTDWAERRFQKEVVQLRRDLPGRLDDLREFASVDAIAAAVVDEVEGALRPARICLLAGGEPIAARNVESAAVAAWARRRQHGNKMGLGCDSTDPLFPIRLPLGVAGRGIVAWLLLGPRPDGSLSGSEEREALAVIAAPAARALLIAGEREKRSAADADRARRLSAEIWILAQRLESLEAQRRV